MEERRGSFYFLVHERKKNWSFFCEKNADSSLEEKKKIFTALIKREELERKEEEERERERERESSAISR